MTSRQYYDKYVKAETALVYLQAAIAELEGLGDNPIAVALAKASYAKVVQRLGPLETLAEKRLSDVPDAHPAGW